MYQNGEALSFAGVTLEELEGSKLQAWARDLGFAECWGVEILVSQGRGLGSGSWTCGSSNPWEFRTSYSWIRRPHNLGGLHLRYLRPLGLCRLRISRIWMIDIFRSWNTMITSQKQKSLESSLKWSKVMKREKMKWHSLCTSFELFLTSHLFLGLL